jgi:hypothetical protein
MTTTEIPWEPPLAASEAEQLIGCLDRLRATFRYKADGLDSAGLGARLPTSALTLGGLLKHLAAMEDYTTTHKLAGTPLGAPWDGFGWDGSTDWDLESASEDTPEQLYDLYDSAVDRSRARIASALAGAGPDQSIHASDERGHANLRRLVLDLIEEYGRHTGHADLIRESVDGRVGEDPPADWRPVSGHFRFHA